MERETASSPYRDRFDCLWCGTAWITRGPNDLEGLAQLCPACVGKAGDNPFLRGRLRRALAARAAATRSAIPADVSGSHARPDRSSTAPAPPVARAAGAKPAPRRPPPAAFPDDWFLRRGAFERGAIHDTAWAAELDIVTRWVDGLGLHGRLVEPAAGVGFFSPLLADAGELYAFDPDADALDRARDRLAAHGVRAHLHPGDAWTTPVPDPGPADGVLAAFLLGRVRGAGLDAAIESLRDRLAPGGRLVVLDLLPDPDGGPPPGIPWTWHAPPTLEASLRRAGMAAVQVGTSGRFFLRATALR